MFSLATVCLGFILLAAHPLRAVDMGIVLSSGTVQPGDTLRIELNDLPPERPMRVEWNNRTYRFYPVGPNAQRALIGVPLTSVPGSYPLRVAGGQTVAVEIAARTFLIDHVNFPSEKTRLFNEKLERQESARIRAVLRQLRSGQYWEGRFDPPVQGPVIGEFGTKRIRNKTIEAGFHKGVDLKAAMDTPILASNGGIVALSYPFKLHGRTVVIDHGQGVMTIYLHMKSYSVFPGRKVAKGEVIGKVGSTGLSTAPHVHWGLYVHGVPVDPAPWTLTEF